MCAAGIKCLGTAAGILHAAGAQCLAPPTSETLHNRKALVCPHDKGSEQMIVKKAYSAKAAHSLQEMLQTAFRIHRIAGMG